MCCKSFFFPFFIIILFFVFRHKISPFSITCMPLQNCQFIVKINWMSALYFAPSPFSIRVSHFLYFNLYVYSTTAYQVFGQYKYIMYNYHSKRQFLLFFIIILLIMFAFYIVDRFLLFLNDKFSQQGKNAINFWFLKNYTYYNAQ